MTDPNFPKSPDDWLDWPPPKVPIEDAWPVVVLYPNGRIGWAQRDTTQDGWTFHNQPEVFAGPLWYAPFDLDPRTKSKLQPLAVLTPHLEVVPADRWLPMPLPQHVNQQWPVLVKWSDGAVTWATPAVTDGGIIAWWPESPDDDETDKLGFIIAWAPLSALTPNAYGGQPSVTIHRYLCGHDRVEVERGPDASIELDTWPCTDCMENREEWQSFKAHDARFYARHGGAPKEETKADCASKFDNLENFKGKPVTHPSFVLPKNIEEEAAKAGPTRLVRQRGPTPVEDCPFCECCATVARVNADKSITRECVACFAVWTLQEKGSGNA